MNRPGSATISKPPMAPSSPVQHQTRGPDTEQKDLREQHRGRNKLLVCRSIIIDRTQLESIGGALRTQTLARSRIGREVPPVCGEPCGLGSAHG